MNLVSADFWTGLIPIVLIIAVVWFLWKAISLYRERNRNVSDAENKMIAEICTMDGRSEEYLVQAEEGIIKLGEKHQNLVGRLKDGVGRIFKAPDELENAPEDYWIFPEFLFSMAWPKNRPKFVQVTIKKAMYLENDSMPQITYRPELWEDPEKAKIVSAQMSARASNQEALKAVNDISHEVFKDLSQLAEAVKKIPTIWLAILAILGVLGINTFMVYQVMNFLAS